MVYLPQVVFKHILSFKDPRYERVMDGNPYMATPTRVFVAGRKEWHRYKHLYPLWLKRTDFQSDRPDEFGDVGSYVHSTEFCLDLNCYATNTELSLDPMRHIRHREAKIHPEDYYREPDDAIKCSYKAIEMSLQCEACGPDLELYQRRR